MKQLRRSNQCSAVKKEEENRKTCFCFIQVPHIELPDPEQEDGNPESSLKAIEKKWTDLAIQRITNQ